MDWMVCQGGDCGIMLNSIPGALELLSRSIGGVVGDDAGRLIGRRIVDPGFHSDSSTSPAAEFRQATSTSTALDVISSGIFRYPL